MKILITGMSANQTNPLSRERTVNFAGMMYEQLTDAGISVVWQDPELDLDVSGYDRILIGLVSPLALGASKSYGALALVERLWDDPRLVLYLDAPDPNTITRGLLTISRSPQTLTKEFFSARANYATVVRDIKVRSQVYGATDKLLNQPWPKTLVPAFPWTSVESIARELPPNAANQELNTLNITLVNLDRLVMDKQVLLSDASDIRWDKWYFERGGNKSWLRKNKGSHPIYSLKSNYREDLREYYPTNLSKSTGFLHAPCRRDLIWWTPQVAISLSQNTPVVTGSAAKALGDQWSMGTKTIEMLLPKTRHQLAGQQKMLYIEGQQRMTTNLLGAL